MKCPSFSFIRAVSTSAGQYVLTDNVEVSELFLYQSGFNVISNNRRRAVCPVSELFLYQSGFNAAIAYLNVAVTAVCPSFSFIRAVSTKQTRQLPTPKRLCPSFSFIRAVSTPLLHQRNCNMTLCPSFSFIRAVSTLNTAQACRRYRLVSELFLYQSGFNIFAYSVFVVSLYVSELFLYQSGFNSSLASAITAFPKYSVRAFPLSERFQR